MLPCPVVIVADQRSGTNLLRRSLATSSLFMDCAEVFHPKRYTSCKSLLLSRLFNSLGWSPSIPEKNFWNFKRTAVLLNPSLNYPSEDNNRKLFGLFLRNLEKSSSKIPLIDIKYNSIHHLESFWRHASYEPPFLFKLLAELKIPVIHLIRRNSFESYVSFKMAETSRVWVSKEDSIHNDARLTIALDDMFEAIYKRQDEIRLYQTWLRETESLNVLELSYESLLDSDRKFDPGVKRKICDFLNISEDFPLEIPTRKLVSKPMSQLIVNYDQVVSVLTARGFGQFV